MREGSCVMCHVSHVTFHVSHITYHMLHITRIYKVVKLVVVGSVISGAIPSSFRLFSPSLFLPSLEWPPSCWGKGEPRILSEINCPVNLRLILKWREFTWKNLDTHKALPWHSWESIRHLSIATHNRVTYSSELQYLAPIVHPSSPSKLVQIPDRPRHLWYTNWTKHKRTLARLCYLLYLQPRSTIKINRVFLSIVLDT